MNVSFIDGRIQTQFLRRDLLLRFGVVSQGLVHGFPARSTQNTKGFAQKTEVHHGLEAQIDEMPEKFTVFDANHGLPITVLLNEHDD